MIADRMRKANKGSDFDDEILIDSQLKMNFVLYNNYDSTKAANQLMSYIEMRKSLFGKRSGLHMNQTTGE
jgi:hypothetical protein